MSGGPKISSGPSIPSFRSINAETKTSPAGLKQLPQSIQEAFSNNSAMRSFRGESSFEGVGGPGGAQQVGGGGPEEMLNKLGSAIKELVSTLQTLLNNQAGGTDASTGAADDASGIDATSGTGDASATDGTDAAQDASSADGSEDPLQQIFDTLKQLLGMLDQFQQSQGSVPDTSTASPAVSDL